MSEFVAKACVRSSSLCFFSRLDEIINGLFEKHVALDMDRLRSIIQMKIFEIKDKVSHDFCCCASNARPDLCFWVEKKFEDHPHDIISKICIGDFLYGDENERTVSDHWIGVVLFSRIFFVIIYKPFGFFICERKIKV
jgi:hypothetical protein